MVTAAESPSGSCSFPSQLLGERAGVCPLCGAGQSDWGRSRKSGTLELITLKKAGDSCLAMTGSWLRLLALKTIELTC